MEKSWTMPITVGPERLTLHGATNTPDTTASGVVNIDGNLLKTNLDSIMSKLDEMLSEAAERVKHFSVAELKVSLAIDASGSISILGVAKGTLGTKGAIEVKFKPAK